MVVEAPGAPLLKLIELPVVTMYSGLPAVPEKYFVVSPI
jgi:hypothetical protein